MDVLFVALHLVLLEGEVFQYSLVANTQRKGGKKNWRDKKSASQNMLWYSFCMALAKTLNIHASLLPLPN